MTKPSFAAAKAAKTEIDAICNRLGAELDGFPKGPTGLTPDAVKFSPEYRAAKAAFNTAFANVRAFNAQYVKLYAKELKAARMARRLAAEAEEFLTDFNNVGSRHHY